MFAVWLMVSGLAAVSPPLFEQALRPLRGVTPPKEIASLSAKSCASCHAAIYQQWRSSRHRQSWDNALFAASFRYEPMQWCINCHAPLPQQASLLSGLRLAKVPSELVAEGITCAVCHMRDGVLLSAKPPGRAAQRAHPIRHAPQLARAEFCGGCHQFNVPHDQPPLHYTDQPMQDTLAEWQRSSAAQAGQSCQHCHMPRAEHSFRGAHDVTYLKSSVSVNVSRLANGSITVRLQAHGVGHNVPTGDPFRRLELRLCAAPACTEVLGSLSFNRVFAKVDGGSRLHADRTIPTSTLKNPAERSVLVEELGPEATHYQLIYGYAAPGTEKHLSRSETELIIAQGPITSTPSQLQ